MEDWDSLPKIKNNLVDNILKIFSNKNLDSANIDDDLIRSSSNAYEQYLKAKYILKTRSNEKDYKKLEEILNALISNDKNFIAPYLLFGDYYLAIAKYNKSLKPNPKLPKKVNSSEKKTTNTIKKFATSENYDLIIYQNAAFVSDQINITNQIISKIEELSP